MTKGLKALVGVVLVFSLLISGVGYASLTDTLAVTGSASAEAAKGVYISSVEESTALTSVQYATDSEPTLITAIADLTNAVTVRVTVKNNTNDDYMYYGVNYAVLDATGLDYRVDVTYNGNPYIAARDGDSENRIDAIEGTIIDAGDSHELIVTITRTGGINTSGNIGFILNYKPATEFTDWVKTSYIITFTDGTNPVNVTVGGTATGKNTIEVELGNGYNVSSSNVKPTTIPSGKTFQGWYLATDSDNVITSIPADNTEDITLYPSWSSFYTITFQIENSSGDFVYYYSETFVPGPTTTLSQTGQDKLNEYLETANADPDRLYTASWPTYDLTLEQDITVNIEWTYTGTANLEPGYTDGVHDHYTVGVMDKENGKQDVIIPSAVDGKPVTGIDEGAFAEYDDITNIRIPTSITTIEADAFADSGTDETPIIGHKETIQFYYEGNRSQWDAISKDANWDRYLGENSVIVCTDGVYRLENTGSWLRPNYVWVFYPWVVNGETQLGPYDWSDIDSIKWSGDDATVSFDGLTSVD